MLHYYHHAPQNAPNVRVIGGAWAPAALFSAGETGFAWDVSAANALYQERTGASATTPATANADPVGSVKDVSGQNNWFTVPTNDTKRATLSISGALKSLSFDATDDEYSGPAGLNGILDDKDFFVGVAASNWQVGAERLVYSSLSNIYVGVPASQGDLMSLRYSLFFNVGSSQSAQTPVANVWTWNCTSGTLVGRRGGSQQGSSVSVTGGPFSGNQAFVGSRSGTFSSVKFYRLIVLSRSLSAGELASAETWLGAGAGLTL